MNRRFIDLKIVGYSVGKEAENDFKVTIHNLNHRFTTISKSHFGLVNRQKMSSQCLTTT